MSIKKYLSINGLHTVVGKLNDLINSKTDLSDVLNVCYPVGSIYISVTNSNPKGLFGFGEWEQLKDVFILSAGDTYVAGSHGGVNSNTLTEENMPQRVIMSIQNDTGQTVRNSGTLDWVSREVESGVYVGSCLFDVVRANMNTTLDEWAVPINNMPPYMVVYMWKRIL